VTQQLQARQQHQQHQEAQRLQQGLLGLLGLLALLTLLVQPRPSPQACLVPLERPSQHDQEVPWAQACHAPAVLVCPSGRVCPCCLACRSGRGGHGGQEGRGAPHQLCPGDLGSLWGLAGP